MRHYETLFIINPEISEEETDAVVEKFSGILADGGAMITMIDKWGRRRLAYQVKKFYKGFYVLFEYGASPEAVAEMERNFKIDEKVIRYLTVLKDKEFDAEAAAQAMAEAEAQAMAEAEAKAAEAEAKAAEAERKAAEAKAAEAADSAEAKEEQAQTEAETEPAPQEAEAAEPQQDEKPAKAEE